MIRTSTDDPEEKGNQQRHPGCVKKVVEEEVKKIDCFLDFEKIINERWRKQLLKNIKMDTLTTRTLTFGLLLIFTSFTSTGET